MSDIHPNLPGLTFITELEHALGLHNAASESRLLRNRAPYDKSLNPAAIPQRQALLDIITDLLINARNKALDEFCVAWLKHRALPIPDKEDMPSGSS